MSDRIIGVRLARNSPVLFVTADRSDRVTGDRVVIVLSTCGQGDNCEQEASVVISADQLLSAPDLAPSGHVVRSA